MKRYVIIVAGIMVVMFVAWDQWRRQPEIQVPATFARLAEAFADHDASGVMTCVDRQYDFTGKWPELFPDQSKARGEAQRLLAMAFFQTRTDQLQVVWHLDDLQIQADRSVLALVSVRVSSDGGGLFARAVPPLQRHQFRLVKGGVISGRYRIADHAPFVLNVPSL